MSQKYFAATLVVFGMCACTPEPPLVSVVSEPHCTESADRAALATFIVECARAANPMSDEEGEDLVAQCMRTGIIAICPDHIHRKTYQRNTYEWSVEEMSP